MSALGQIDSFAVTVTRYAGDSSEELSSALLVMSAVALGAAGVGLIFLCVRALLRRREPRPTQPWIARALVNPTVHTQKYEELAVRSGGRASIPSPPPPSEAPLPLRRQSSRVVAPTVPMAAPPSSAAGPSSTDPTLEMDLGAFASSDARDSDTKIGVPTFEMPPPPPDPAPAAVARAAEAPVVPRPASLPMPEARYVRTMSAFNDGARRA